jgi:hypothetical protein
MHDVKRTDTEFTCQWCRMSMELEVYIAPLGNQEGLAIYKCPECDRLEDEFIAPDTSERKAEGP